MIQEVTVAAVSAIAGALALPALHKIWSCLRPPKPSPPAPFDPGLCDELPLHKWTWDKEKQKFFCPKCIGYQHDFPHPQYCAERGGHFHFKCRLCG